MAPVFGRLLEACSNASGWTIWETVRWGYGVNGYGYSGRYFGVHLNTWSADGSLRPVSGFYSSRGFWSERVDAMRQSTAEGIQSCRRTPVRLTVGLL